MNRRWIHSFSWLGAFWLASLTGGSAAGQAPGGPAAPASVASVDPLLAELTRQLTEHFRWEGEWQIELLRTWALPAGAEGPLEISVLEFPASPSPAMLLRTRILARGQVLAEPTFTIRARLWREAWMTRQPVALGAAFDPSQLDVRRVDALRDREALPVEAAGREFVFARTVPAGRLLTWRDVARRPLVRKGDVIEVAVLDGSLSISLKAMAMESGAAGDVVRVRNLQSKREFSAQVVSEARAQVHF